MRLLAIAALALLSLASSQAPSPTPAKTTQKQQNEADPEKHKGTADQDHTESSPATIGEPSPKIAAWNRQNSSNCCQRESPANRTPVVFSALLTLFTFGLVSLGFLQWRVMRKQRKAMDAQAGYIKQQWETLKEQISVMKRQTELMQGSITAAENNAVAALDNAQTAQDSLNMFISKERARLRVELADVRDTSGYLLVPITLALSGVSEAEILDFRCACTAGAKEDLTPISAMLMSWVPEDYPRVITPSDPRPELSRVAIPSATFKGENQSTIATLLKTGELDVFCRGSILYQDIFGQKWRRNFSRMWTYDTILGTLGASGRWVDYGEQRDNEEKRAEE